MWKEANSGILQAEATSVSENVICKAYLPIFALKFLFNIVSKMIRILIFKSALKVKMYVS